MCKFLLLPCLVILLLQSCGVSPKPIKLPCSLNSSEFTSRVQDSLRTYGFDLLSMDSLDIHTIRKVEDGLSVRTVYLSVSKDALSGEWNMVVRMIVAYHGEITEFYIDEQPRLTNDFRRDFKPALTAIRSMCAPPPKKKKKVAK
jgi:hypothetical protein